MTQVTTSNSTTTTIARSSDNVFQSNHDGATTINKAAKGLPIARAGGQNAWVGIPIQIGMGALLVYLFDVPAQDIGFSVGFPLYMLAANHFCFDSNGTLRQKDPQFSFLERPLLPYAAESWFPYYMGFFALVGLAAPLATIYEGPQEVAVLAAPHLFVLWAQIIVETATMPSAYVHNYIKVMGPVAFCLYRIPMLLQWSSAAREMLAAADADAPLLWYQWSAFLATLGLIVWTYNTFYMLLLKLVPSVLDPERCPSPEAEPKGLAKKKISFSLAGCFLLAVALSSASSKAQKD